MPWTGSRAVTRASPPRSSRGEPASLSRRSSTPRRRTASSLARRSSWVAAPCRTSTTASGCASGSSRGGGDARPPRSRATTGVCHLFVSQCTSAHGPFPSAETVQAWAAARHDRRTLAEVARAFGVPAARIAHHTAAHGPFPPPSAPGVSLTGCWASPPSRLAWGAIALSAALACSGASTIAGLRHGSRAGAVVGPNDRPLAGGGTPSDVLCLPRPLCLACQASKRKAWEEVGPLSRGSRGACDARCRGVVTVNARSVLRRLPVTRGRRPSWRARWPTS